MRVTKKTTSLLAIVLLGVLAGAASAEVQFESASPLSNKDGGKAETAIGSLFADAVRTVAKADIAFIACSELKPTEDSYPHGKLSSSQLALLVSYPNDSLAVVELTGKSVRAALERALALYPRPNMGFLQVSGLRFVFDPNKQPGERVISVDVGSAPLSDQARYRVAMTSSMAGGALGYWKIWSAKNVTTKLSDWTLVSALEAYLAENPVINYANLGRIRATSK